MNAFVGTFHLFILAFVAREKNEINEMNKLLAVDPCSGILSLRLLAFTVSFFYIFLSFFLFCISVSFSFFSIIIFMNVFRCSSFDFDTINKNGS